MSTQQPTIALLIMTDGRNDLLKRTIESFAKNVTGNIVDVLVHVDAANPVQALTAERIVRDAAPAPVGTSRRLIASSHRSGFGGAIRRAWQFLGHSSTADYVFHLEDDFTFNRPVNLDHLTEVMQAVPELAQMALRRQPWNDAERAAGGVIEQHPDSYVRQSTSAAAGGFHHWLRHDRFFTTNPCVYRRRVPPAVRGGVREDVNTWPSGLESEGRYGIRLRQHGYSFGFWGVREQTPWVEHIGVERIGNGY